MFQKSIEMNSLFEYLESIYTHLPFLAHLEFNSLEIIKSNKFEDLINDDKKCIELISSVLEFPMEAVSINRDRASHIIVTWLLGVGFGEFIKSENKLTGFADLYKSRLWLQSAIIHDYGYFCQEIENFLPIEALTKDYDLLTDTYSVDELQCLNGLSSNSETRCFFTYSYSEIKNYYRYIQSQHKDESNDRISNDKSLLCENSDHGIVGGCKAFHKYCKYITSLKAKLHYGSSSVITKIQKISCIIAASHNIYKADAKNDNCYMKFELKDLTSTSPIRITRSNFLLLLLSLVDTIECTKRFSKKANAKEYLWQSTILKYVDINVNNQALKIDFSRLDNYLLENRKSKDMRQKLKGHIQSIINLGSWTDFFATNDPMNEKLVTISFKQS